MAKACFSGFNCMSTWIQMKPLEFRFNARALCGYVFSSDPARVTHLYATCSKHPLEMNWCSTKLGVHMHSSKPQPQLNCCKNIKKLNLKLPQGQILFLQPCSSENISISRIMVFVVLRKGGSGKDTLHWQGKIRRCGAGLKQLLFHGHSLCILNPLGENMFWDWMTGYQMTSLPLHCLGEGKRNSFLSQTAGTSAAHKKHSRDPGVWKQFSTSAEFSSPPR